ncbi:50S ribosomal protein L6 [Desulfosoma caldarium]|uniref:Large ribosomal subunit protein uL6 n=1 Tax=Desulfosoma caldarium TaxID=610254 RepID=A0A3N1VII9_9BACT|nr:50S ribosomal protein L6 [Desulfosoma caldarium]ROR01720.1 LSU ribosomal protein L6P [Desulfosoma caldarium]
MSRIGKNPIPIPKGVDVTLQGDVVVVKGLKGQLERRVPSEVTVSVEDGHIVVRRKSDQRRARAMHGLTRVLLHNMVTGVSQGFTKVLEIHGVGYRCDVSKNVLTFTLGHSHPISFPLAQGVSASVEKQTVIRLEAVDKELLGQTAANIKALRPVEPYKGKGIRYADQWVRRKAGKTGAKKK